MTLPAGLVAELTADGGCQLPVLGKGAVVDRRPRFRYSLRDRGVEETVAELMAESGLTARRRRGLTKADKAAAKPPDLVGRRFAPPEAPDRQWVGDLTEIPNGQGRLYLLASVLNLHSRRIVGSGVVAQVDHAQLTDLGERRVQADVALPT
jgi:transposase InsO family protein